MIAGVVLAAGASHRYGSPKQLERLDGECWVRLAARLALEGGCERVLVVVGAHADGVSDAVRGLARVETLVHPEWRRGVGSSIAAGTREITRDQAVNAALFVPCDQIHLDSAILSRMIQLFDGFSMRTVACAYAETIGVPAIFERGWFDRLSGLDGDSGAKSLLLERPELRIDVDWPAGAEDRDRKHETHG